MDIMTILSSIILSSIVASNFTTPSLFFHPELHLIICATLGIKLISLLYM